MEIMLTDIATLTINNSNTAFSIHTIVERGCNKGEIVNIRLNGSIKSIDVRIGCNSYIITFDDKEGSHILSMADFEEPLLDGELMFI